MMGIEDLDAIEREYVNACELHTQGIDDCTCACGAEFETSHNLAWHQKQRRNAAAKRWTAQHRRIITDITGMHINIKGAA